MKSTRLATLCLAFGLASFLSLNARAAIYGDPSNDLFDNGFANLDITSVEVTNNGVNLVIAVTTRAFQNWTKYLIWIDTPSRSNAPANSNSWNRPASMAAGEGADYFIGSWVDQPNNNASLNQYGGSPAAWSETAVLSNVQSGNTVTFTIPLSTLGLSAGNVIKFDVATSGGNADPGVDHASRSTQATTGWAAPSTGGPMLSYTIASLADSDSDGLTDTWENTYFGNLAQTGSGDPDSDGLTNSGELTAGTDPTKADTDNDGLNDGAEVTTHTTNPLVADTDGDGVNDGAEVAAGTNPKKTNYSQITAAGSFQGWSPAPAADSSNVLTRLTGDEFGWELSFKFPNAANFIGKFTTGGWGVNWGTSATAGVLQLGGLGNDIPFNVTASGVWRFYFNTDTLAYSFTRRTFANYAAFQAAYSIGVETEDADSDNLTNFDEFTINSDPTSADTDGDTVPDAQESFYGTSPILADTDADGLPDPWELTYGLDPTDNGTKDPYANNTGLTVAANPNGASSDPDADGLTNAQEFAANSNPLATGTGLASTYAKMVVAGSFVKTKPDGNWDEVGNAVNTMQLVSNFTWKLIVYVPAPLPTFAQFKFTTGNWNTNFGDNATADGIGDANGANINALPAFTAAGHYIITFNDFSKAYTIAAVSATDGDSDGLPDEWEAFYGGYLSPKITNLVPSTVYIPGGMQTAAEAYAAGTNPVADTAAPTITLATGVDKVTWVAKDAAVVLANSDVTATDNLPASPTVTFLPATVDTTVDGLTTVTYTATDAAGNASTTTRVIAVGAVSPGYRNLRFPASMTVNSASSNSAYGEIYLEGATPGAGAATGIRAWVGVNTNNTDPATWEESVWSAANYVGEEGNNDNYQGQVSGVGRTPGAYFYATRFQLGTNNTNYHFGGIGTDGVGGTWGGIRQVVSGGVTNAITNGNGVLTVQSGRTLTFAVNMNVQTNKSLFNRATQGVEVRGTFNNWSGGSTLTDGDNDGIYTGSFAVGGELGTAIAYKFYTTGAGAGGFEPLVGDRSYTLGANAVNETIPPIYFNNDDGIGPVITLTGASTINLTVGGFYTELGATATDAIDGSVTVTPSGTVNTALAGTYTVNYNASDAAGNAAAQVTRTVVVAAADPLADYLSGFGLSGANAAGTADPDGDGMDNNAELAFGTSPVSGASRAAMLATGTGTIKLTYLQRDSGVNYTVKSLPDLATAFDSGTTVTPSVSADQSNKPAGYTRYEAELNTGSTRGFLRVRAVR